MRKICAIALAAMLGMATPVFMSESAHAQTTDQQDVSPVVYGVGAGLLGLLIWLIFQHHHHQVSP